MHIVPRMAGLPAAAFAAALTIWPAPAPAQESRYTRVDFSKCPEAKSPEPGVIEVRRCVGPGGVPVTLTSEPDAALVTFGKAPLDEALGLGSFHQPGDTIEWRGDAAIVRYQVGASVEKLDRSVLAVYRLERSGRSCVMAIVHEPGANVKARRVADAEAPRFRCGTSARLDR